MTGIGTVERAPPEMLFTRAKMAPPPTHVWIPNQPQATSARRMEGMLLPQMPKEARARTGNGTPESVGGRGGREGRGAGESAKKRQGVENGWREGGGGGREELRFGESEASWRLRERERGREEERGRTVLRSRVAVHDHGRENDSVRNNDREEALHVMVEWISNMIRQKCELRSKWKSGPARGSGVRTCHQDMPRSMRLRERARGRKSSRTSNDHVFM